MTLRNYQHDSIEKIEEGLARGINKQVIVLATGLGKTIIFSHLIKKRNRETGGRALILAHREELLTQAKDKLSRVAPELRVDIEQAANRADHRNADVVIASVQTLGRTGSERIKRFKPEDYTTIVVDEAHHSSAQTYQTILSYFGTLKGESDWNKNCLLLGVTATPSRNDNQGIDQIFDEVVFNYDIITGIQNGWLSRIRAYRVNTKTSLTEVHRVAGDFNQGELADAVNNPERNKLIIKTYLEKCKTRQALCFAVDKQHAMDICKEFQNAGVEASYITDDLKKGERQARLKAFYDKDIQVMVNCMVLTEGYDNEGIDVIMMARPTQSGILYQQMVGRGTRLATGKNFLAIIDFVDNVVRQRLQTSASLLGIEGKVDFLGEDILFAKEKIDELLSKKYDYDLDNFSMDKIQYALQQVDVLGGLAIPPEIKEFTANDWCRAQEEGYQLSCGNYRYLKIYRTLTNQYSVLFTEWNKETKEESMVDLGNYSQAKGAIQMADAYLKANHPEALRLTSSKAAWKSEPATDKQKDTLRKFKEPEWKIAQYDKGAASKRLTELIGRR